MPDLLLAVPSRGRPGNIARLIDAMNATCRGSTQLVVGLDLDDPTRPMYPGYVCSQAGDWPDPETGALVLPADEDAARPGTEYEVRSGLRQVVGWMNAIVMSRIDSCKYVGHIGDDNVPLTVGWDVQIMEALEKTPFAYGNDLYGRPAPPNPSALCCHVFMRKAIPEALGFFGWPGFRHMYVDVAWMQWGEAAGITYLEDCIIEHRHYTNGKAAADESYHVSTALIPEDLTRYQAYCEDPSGLVSDIQTIKLAAVRSFPEMAAQFPEMTAGEMHRIIRERNLNYNVPSTPPPAGWKPGDPLQ